MIVRKYQDSITETFFENAGVYTHPLTPPHPPPHPPFLVMVELLSHKPYKT